MIFVVLLCHFGQVASCLLLLLPGLFLFHMSPTSPSVWCYFTTQIPIYTNVLTLAAALAHHPDHSLYFNGTFWFFLGLTHLLFYLSCHTLLLSSSEPDIITFLQTTKVSHCRSFFIISWLKPYYSYWHHHSQIFHQEGDYKRIHLILSMVKGRVQTNILYYCQNVISFIKWA